MTKYGCADTEGRARWVASAQIVHNQANGPDSYTLTEKGEGVLSGFKGKVSWEARLDFESTKDVVRPLYSETRVFDGSRKLIFKDRQDFNYNTHKARYNSEDLIHKKTRKAEYSFNGAIVNKMILGLYIQKFLEREKREEQLLFLSNEPRLYIVKLKVVGEEDIGINGIKKKAFKLCLDPQLGALNFVKTLIPKSYVWHSSAPEFEWLRYRGLENSLGSPMVEITSEDIR